jgi:hypothetical protein
MAVFGSLVAVIGGLEAVIYNNQAKIGAEIKTIFHAAYTTAGTSAKENSCGIGNVAL